MERTGFEQWKPREVARLLALVEAERRYYQEIVATLPAALVALASDRTIVSANRAFRALVGQRTEDLRQKTIDQVLPSHELIEAIRSAHVHGNSKPVRLNLGDRALRVAILPIRGWEEDLEPETVLMVEELSGMGAPAVALDLPGLPAILWEADPVTLGFTAVRGATDSILGYSAEHWIKTPRFVSERIHPEDREAVMALYQARAAMGGEASAEFRAISAAGEAVWCRETMRVADVAGRGLIAAGVLTPIGQRRQMEAQSIVAGRSEALRALAARLAHDLNNPLMIVNGYGEEILQSLPAGDPVRADVAEILSAATRMSELTAHLLNFAQPAAKAAAKLALRDAVPGWPRVVGGVAVSASMDASAEKLWIFADREQLRDTIEALAAWVAEHTREVSRISVICRADGIGEQLQPATLAPGSYARIEIRAQGGAGETAAGSAFEAFLPSKDAAHASGPAVARGYAAVRLWGGDIFYAGGSFAAYLLCAAPEGSGEESRAAVEAPVAAPEPERVQQPPNKTILLVEDEPGIRALVRKILRRENYTVVEAGSAEEALTLEAALGGRVDLLLSDMMLPGMTGRDLAERLHAKNPQIRVVYISGYTEDASVRAGGFPPGAKFLQKPFTLGSLIGAVRAALE